MGAVEGLGPGWPWWASLSVALLWVLLYIYRSVCRYRLLSKALDKVTAERVPEVAVFINIDKVPRWRRRDRTGQTDAGDGAA